MQNSTRKIEQFLAKFSPKGYFLFKKKLFWPLIIFVLFVIQIIDRGNWSNVTQWKEDQATNLWLGFTQSLLNMPVGLISSKSIPNPNGMVILSVCLSRLPDLWFISLFLGVIQGVLVLWVAWLLFGKRNLFFCFCLPVLASVVLRATSVEFWNQWILTSINLLFWGLWIKYLQKPTSLKIPWLILPILIAPALYLGGLVNAVLFLIFILIGLWVAHPQGNIKTHLLAIVLSLIFISLSIWLTWIPYFQATVGYNILGSHLDALDVQTRIVSAFLSGISFPIWNTYLWSRDMGILIYQGSSQILPAITVQFFHVTDFLLLIQSVIFLPILIFGLIVHIIKYKSLKNFFIDGYKFAGVVLLAGMGFVILAYMLSPFLGGLVWAEGKRVDQQIQFFPFFLFAWFTIPFVVNLPFQVKIITRAVTAGILAGFIVISLVSGNQVVTSYLHYKGNVLTDSDVTLHDKMQVVDFAAQEWKLISKENSIPIYYDLGIQRWDWVNDFGKGMEKWYPSVYTNGRGFDFELLRVYGLHNSQEGIQDRTSNTARYIVTYAFMPEPKIQDAKITSHIFGRLRVSVISK